MKKFLLGTTILISTLAISTSVYAREGHKNRGGTSGNASLNVYVGGFIDFQSGFADQDTAFRTGANSRDLKFQNDTEIHVRAEGKADNGLKYGAVIELEADVTGDADSQGKNADKTYIFVESSAGRIELGNTEGAEAISKVDASSIARATGGIDGDFYDFVNTNGVSGTALFIITPDLTAAHERGITEDATKIAYYTPRFSGLQVGVSFTPDEGNGGTALGFTSDTNGDNQNVLGVGVNYENNYDGLDIAASLTGEFGTSELNGIEDLSTLQTGISLSKQGFSVAGSYADWGKSGLSTTATANDQNFWTLGTAYETGPFGVSLTYLNSTRTNNDFTNLSLGTDYQLAPGLVPYVEVNFFDLDEAGTTTDNNGSVVLVGMELSF